MKKNFEEEEKSDPFALKIKERQNKKRSHRTKQVTLQEIQIAQDKERKKKQNNNAFDS